jgi:predicted RNA-binding Zn-ribbon protein involved in translation (DUF1610 family)
MSHYINPSAYQDWICLNCGLPLKPGKVDVSYLGNSFAIELLKCPNCGLVLVPEELALGKMAEIEKTLEDK